MRTLRTILLPALLAPAVLTAQSGAQRVDTTFAFERGGSVALGLVSGEIRVVTGRENEVRLLATIERGRLETTLTRSHVSVQAKSVNGRMGAARYELTVPVGTRVDANAVSGTITVRGTGTEVEAHTVSGGIRVEDASGIVDVGTVSGDIDLRNASGRISVATVSGEFAGESVRGDLEAEAVSGTITVRRGGLRSFRASTVSGDVSYDGTLAPGGDYRINAHSGDVTLAVPANGGVSLDLETWSGEITSDFPLTLQPGDNLNRRNRRMTFTIGQGGARLSAETFSGDIAIRRAPVRTPEE